MLINDVKVCSVSQQVYLNTEVCAVCRAVVFLNSSKCTGKSNGIETVI